MNIEPSSSRHHIYSRSRQGQRGVVAIEFALVFLFGLLPLLLLTFSGVLIFAAKQSLTLAAANGARASLHYSANIEGRRTYACTAASASMKWLLTFSNEAVDCSNPPTPSSESSNMYVPIAVSNLGTCTPPAPAGVQCITVKTSFDYDAHPFLPGTKTVYHWTIGSALSSTATIQIDTSGS
jgi:Flp pilus assembly protein TadG